MIEASTVIVKALRELAAAERERFAANQERDVPAGDPVWARWHEASRTIERIALGLYPSDQIAPKPRARSDAKLPSFEALITGALADLAQHLRRLEPCETPTDYSAANGGAWNARNRLEMLAKLAFPAAPTPEPAPAARRTKERKRT